MHTVTTAPHTDQANEALLRIKAATPRVIVVPALLAINIGVYLVSVALGVSVLGGRAEEYLRFGANFAPLTTGGEWWRLVTCTFVHFGILQLAINLWALWDSGRLTERLFGNRWFGALYLFAGVAGGCASMLWNQQVISAGASGAIFGVYGALLAFLTLQRGSIPADILNRLRISSGVFVTYSLFYGFAQTGIDNAAHLGGLAGGYAMGLVMARPLAPRLRDAGNARRAVLAALLATITLPTAALLTPDTGLVYRQAIALQKGVESFSAEETHLIAAFQSIVDQTRSGKVSDAVALGQLRSRILPAWDEAVTQLARIELDASAPARIDYDLLLRYAVARRDMIKAVADYLETNDPAHERLIAELRTQADEALRLYQQRQKK